MARGRNGMAGGGSPMATAPTVKAERGVRASGSGAAGPARWREPRRHGGNGPDRGRRQSRTQVYRPHRLKRGLARLDEPPAPLGRPVGVPPAGRRREPASLTLDSRRAAPPEGDRHHACSSMDQPGPDPARRGHRARHQPQLRRRPAERRGRWQPRPAPPPPGREGLLLSPPLPLPALSPYYGYRPVSPHYYRPYYRPSYRRYYRPYYRPYRRSTARDSFLEASLFLEHCPTKRIPVRRRQCGKIKNLESVTIATRS